MNNKMQKYMLKKDLPFAKAGEELYMVHNEETGHFKLYKDIEGISVGYLQEDYIDNFNEWFEKKLDLDECYYITDDGLIDFAVEEDHDINKQRMLVGNIFPTKEEAKKYLEYLKAKEIIKEDAKGFKPNWADEEQMKFSGYWKKLTAKLDYTWERTFKSSTIYFKSIEDIEESLKKHPKEWETYLTYEQ